MLQKSISCAIDPGGIGKYCRTIASELSCIARRRFLNLFVSNLHLQLGTRTSPNIPHKHEKEQYLVSQNVRECSRENSSQED